MVTYVKGFKNASVDVEVTLVDLTSTEEEKKRLLSVYIQKIVTEELYLNVELEREAIVEDLVMEIDGYAEPAWKIPIDTEIPVGQTVKVLGKSTLSGTPGAVTGYIEYEII